MEATIRKPLQGVVNIVRFNWHYYVLAAIVVGLLMLSLLFLSSVFSWVIKGLILITILPVVVSLLVSCYVYDLSDFYQLKWLSQLNVDASATIANINAGFDETSALLRKKYPGSVLKVFDFYDSSRHTELSVARARKIYASDPGTIAINTDGIPLPKGSVDVIFNIFSLHEVRDRNERILFLRHQHAVLKDDGCCVLVEHLRDWPNLVAYNIGFFHFYSAAEWSLCFSSAGFKIESVFKMTPFVSVFIFRKDHGTTS